MREKLMRPDADKDHAEHDHAEDLAAGPSRRSGAAHASQAQFAELGLVMRKADGEAKDSSAAVDGVARASGGAALPAGLAGSYGSRLGADLSGVRVHTDGASAGAAKSISARAFTVGDSMHFAEGAYDPASKDGQRLIAHEATHVAQQQHTAPSAAPMAKREVSQPDQAAEVEADRAADALVDGQGAIAVSAAPAAVSRKDEGDAFKPKADDKDKDAAKAPDMVCDNDKDPKHAGCMLTSEQRSWLRAEVGDRVNVAMVNFLSACQDKKDELKEALKANQELLGTILGFAFGFGVAGPLGSLALAGINKLPTGAPDWMTKVAIGILGKPEYVTGPMKTLTDKAGKAIGDSVGDNAIGFVDSLKENASTWAQTARGEVPGFDDNQLMASYVTWDAKNTKISDYKSTVNALVGRFQSTARIGKEGPNNPSYNPKLGSMQGDKNVEDRDPSFWDPMSPFTTKYQAVWTYYPGVPDMTLALIRHTTERYRDPDDKSKKTSDYFFVRWVEKDMESTAIKMTEAKFGTVDKIPMTAIKGL